jgi:hypothetical protein
MNGKMKRPSPSHHLPEGSVNSWQSREPLKESEPKPGFQDRVEELANRIAGIRSDGKRKVLVSVYGLPDSGKSYLMEKVAAILKQSGIITAVHSGATSRSGIEQIKSFEEEYPPEWSARVFLFHCAWFRQDNYHLDPNGLARSVLGRGIDLNILVTRHSAADMMMNEGDYDMVIVNPEAHRKQPLF